MSTPTDRRTALFARTSTPTLLISLTTLGAVTELSEEERLTHAWIVDELERRHPAVATALEKAFEDAETESDRTGEYADFDYYQVIRDAITS